MYTKDQTHVHTHVCALCLCIRVEAVNSDARPAYADNACQAHMSRHMSGHMSKHTSTRDTFGTDDPSRPLRAVFCVGVEVAVLFIGRLDAAKRVVFAVLKIGTNLAWHGTARCGAAWYGARVRILDRGGHIGHFRMCRRRCMRPCILRTFVSWWILFLYLAGSYFCILVDPIFGDMPGLASDMCRHVCRHVCRHGV